MTDFLGDKFVDADGNNLDRNAIEGFKLILIYYTAEFWGKCKAFKEILKQVYEKANEDGAKNL